MSKPETFLEKFVSIAKRDLLATVVVIVLTTWSAFALIASIPRPLPEGTVTISQAIKTCEQEGFSYYDFYYEESDFKGEFTITPGTEASGLEETFCVISNLPVSGTEEELKTFMLESLDSPKSRQFGEVGFRGSANYDNTALLLTVSVPEEEIPGALIPGLSEIAGSITLILFIASAAILLLRRMKKSSQERAAHIEAALFEFAPDGIEEKIDELLEPARKTSSKGNIVRESNETLEVLQILRREIGAIDKKGEILERAIRKIEKEQNECSTLFKGSNLIDRTPRTMDGQVTLFKDRIRLGLEAFPLTKDTVAEIYTDGNLQVNYTTKMRTSSMAAGVLLPGKAMNWASLDPKAVKHEDDTRTATLLVMSAEWSITLGFAPDNVAVFKVFAHKVNATVKNLK